MKLYTKDELLKKYKGKFIKTIRDYDYSTRTTKWSVISVKNQICENHNSPEEEIEF